MPVIAFTLIIVQSMWHALICLICMKIVSHYHLVCDEHNSSMFSRWVGNIGELCFTVCQRTKCVQSSNGRRMDTLLLCAYLTTELIRLQPLDIFSTYIVRATSAIWDASKTRFGLLLTYQANLSSMNRGRWILFPFGICSIFHIDILAHMSCIFLIIYICSSLRHCDYSSIVVSNLLGFHLLGIVLFEVQLVE